MVDVFERQQAKIDKAKAVSASVDVWGNPVKQRFCDDLATYSGCCGCPEEEVCKEKH